MDDLVLISKLFCVSRLVGLTHCMYSVPFDAAPVSRRLQWLMLSLTFIDCKLMSKEERMLFRHLVILLSVASVLSCGVGWLVTISWVWTMPRNTMISILFPVALATQKFGYRLLR